MQHPTRSTHQRINHQRSLHSRKNCINLVIRLLLERLLRQNKHQLRKGKTLAEKLQLSKNKHRIHAEKKEMELKTSLVKKEIRFLLRHVLKNQ